MSKHNRTGATYGHLTVRAIADKIKGQRTQPWICECDCGKEIQVSSTDLSKGKTASCGCKGPLSLSGYRLVTRMKAKAQRLCKSLPKEEGSLRYFLEPSGKDISRFAAENAIKAGQLQSLGDGLFADTAQTWIAP